MEKEQLQRLLGVVKDASDQFGGIYTRIWDSIRNEPESGSNVAFLSIYKACQDAMDFAMAYEMPETSIDTRYNTSRTGTRFR